MAIIPGGMGGGGAGVLDYVDADAVPLAEAEGHTDGYGSVGICV